MMNTLFTFLVFSKAFPMASWVAQTNIICKCYVLEKLMYQLTTLGFTKLFAFHIIGSYLGNIVSKVKVLELFTIVILGNTFSTISWATQIEIICKSYALWKLTYKHTISGFINHLSLHLLVSCLGYIIENITAPESWYSNLKI